MAATHTSSGGDAESALPTALSASPVLIRRLLREVLREASSRLRCVRRRSLLFSVRLSPALADLGTTGSTFPPPHGLARAVSTMREAPSPSIPLPAAIASIAA